MTETRRAPWWLLPNLLSLDAPVVAVAWLYPFAATWRVNYLPWQAAVALAGAVWVIYVADRLRDARRRLASGLSLQRRHAFHWTHRRKFLAGIVVIGSGTLLLALTSLPREIFNYAAVIAAAIAGFFLTGRSGDRTEVPYFKNILAGFAFGYGTAMTAHVFLPTQHIMQLLFSTEMLAFSVLCIMNISAIDVWEHSRSVPDPQTKAEDEFSITLPLVLLGGAMLLFATRSNDPYTQPLFYSILVGAAALQLINKNRRHFSLDLQRVLADVSLLLPLLFFYSMGV